MSCYEDYDEFYQEPSEFDEKMKELKSYLMDSVKQDIKADLDYYKSATEKSNKELTELKLKNKSLEIENTELHKVNEVADIILSKITKENVESLIANLFEPTFKEETYDCPLHWGLYVNYYNDRETVLKILRYAGIEVPYDSSVILPHEWDKASLDKFFDNMSNHVNCNGQTYSGNIRFWSYRSAQDPFKYTNFTEIPWQFVLRNPLLNSKEYSLKIAKAMSNGGNGYKFSKIYNYQKLDDDVLELLVNNICLNEKHLKSDVGQFIIRHMQYIKKDETFDAVIKILSNMWRPYNEAAKLPEDYQIKYIDSLDEINAKMEFLRASTISKENKSKILSEIL